MVGFVFAPLTILEAGTTATTLTTKLMLESNKCIYREHKAKIVVDSAFKVRESKAMIKSSQQDPSDRDLLLINRDATSICQLSEWGIRMIQAQFPRLQDLIIY